MGTGIRLTADDGHEFGAYQANADQPRGGVVVLQEIFGVNEHIRSVCERFADAGYSAIAPALYDRSSVTGCQLGYQPDDIEVGRKLRDEFAWDDTMRDVAAAADVLQQNGLRVATVGYCWGGSISFLTATRLNLAGAVVYYGAQIMPHVHETANAPLLMHFGEQDKSIPPEDIAAIQAAHPDAAIHTYVADHGFNCDLRPSHHAPSAELAFDRTLEFFSKITGPTN